MLTDEEALARLTTHPLPANPWVYATDRAIIIKAEYTDTIERLLRWAPKTRWSAKHRCWIVPLSGLELVRSILPELSRLAEAMQTQPMAAEEAGGTALPLDATAADEAARRLFRDNARLLYGSDWQRETARALDRNEAALASWLVGLGVMEAPPAVLLGEMLALMRRRVLDIAAAADTLERQLAAGGITPPA
ncbi:hypothetical protein [Ferribacterium limneticum]|uniref:hypothetical protein n=1 Tax=Ferribacterium limneticum TaxID=76259 RepID=UPI001CF9EF30|nr:hypothetical protein [Ferribacterium limneticum]UCV18724.1 hypothetical protein KI610_18355 [Ferribacterium limneticum]